MANKKLLVSYYEDAWIDLDVLPYNKYDYFLIVPFQKPKELDISKSRQFVSFNAKRSNVLMKLLHGIKFMLMLPYLIAKYNDFLFIVPPYFHMFAMPILGLFGKRTASIVGDAYSEIAFEDLWQSSRPVKLIRKIIYPLYVISEYLGTKFNTHLFVVSTYLMRKYRRWGCNPIHLPNGADVQEISNTKPKHIFPEDYVIYFGGLLKWRGIDLLMKAFEEVKKKYNKPLKLVVIGRKDQLRHYPEINLLAKKLGNDLIMPGSMPHEQTMAALKGAKVAILPNRNTLMSKTISSIKVFEHLAAETPQVCTDSGDHALYVKKFGIGVVVKDNAEDIAAGILKVLQPKEQSRIRKNCKKYKHLVDYRVQRKALRVLA